MSGFGKRVDGPRGRRRIERQDVRLVGTATSLNDTRSVLVEDVSWTGAKRSLAEVYHCPAKRF